MSENLDISFYFKEKLSPGDIDIKLKQSIKALGEVEIIKKIEKGEETFFIFKKIVGEHGTEFGWEYSELPPKCYEQSGYPKKGVQSWFSLGTGLWSYILWNQRDPESEIASKKQFWEELVRDVKILYMALKPDFVVGDSDVYGSEHDLIRGGKQSPDNILAWLTFFPPEKVKQIGEAKFLEIPVLQSKDSESEFGECYSEWEAGKRKFLPVWKREKLADGSYLLVLTEQYEAYPSKYESLR